MLTAEVAVGGGGRTIVLHLQSVNKLAVFDARDAKVVKELPLDERDILFAANQAELLVLNPQAKTIDGYKLPSESRLITLSAARDRLVIRKLDVAGRQKLVGM